MYILDMFVYIGLLFFKIFCGGMFILFTIGMVLMLLHYMFGAEMTCVMDNFCWFILQLSMSCLAIAIFSILCWLCGWPFLRF